MTTRNNRRRKAKMIACKASEGYTCDECNAGGVPTVIMMADNEDDSRWFCAPCLRKALALLEPVGETGGAS